MIYCCSSSQSRIIILYLIHRVLHHWVMRHHYSMTGNVWPPLCCLLVETQHDVSAVVVMETERSCLWKQETIMRLSIRQRNVLFEVIHSVVSVSIVTCTCGKTGCSCGLLSSCFVRVTVLPYNIMMAILHRIKRLSHFRVNTSHHHITLHDGGSVIDYIVRNNVTF